MTLMNTKCQLYADVAFLLAAVMTLPLNLLAPPSYAHAGNCANTYPGGGPIINNCAACSGGACGGNWHNVGQYNICTYAADTGGTGCTMTGPEISVGTYGTCDLNTSYIGIMTCAAIGGAGGCGAGVAACITPCVGFTAGYFVCLAACCAGGAAGGAATAFIACCVPTCYCVDSCDPGPSQAFYVRQAYAYGPPCSSGG